MKRTTITKRPPAQGLLAGVLFLLLLMSGCTEADVTRNDNPGQQTGEVETTFDLKVAPSTTPMTRSITLTDKGATEVDTLAVATSASADTLQTRSATELPDAQEEKVANLWIGQYDASGNRLSNQYIESVTGTQVTAKLVVANNCKVRFVANAGNLGAIETETLLDEKTLVYASTADGRPQSNLFAMTGTWTGDITKEATSLPLPTEAPAVMLTRLAAKITFTYKINGEGFTFTPTAVSLKSVPNCSQIGELTTQLTTGVTYGAYSGTVSPAGATMYWYLPENMAGTAAGTNAVQSEKEKTGRGVNNATYIELFGNAVQNGVEYKNVAFRFYPGKDENDYNIKRNDHFVMSIDLKGIDISDKRITIGNIPDITAPTGNLPATGGSKEVQITSRAGVIWSLPLPVWLSATMNGQITPGGSTLTNQGPGKVTFTAGMNQTAEVRSQTYDIKLDDTRSQSFTIAQDASVFNLSANTLELDYPEVTNNTITVIGTPGLAWTVTPSTETSGITPLTTGGTANGSPQAIPFHATKNTGVAMRTATFTVSVPGSDHPAKTITVNQYGINVTIDQDMLTKYVASLTSQSKTLTDYPPFDTDGDNGTAVKTKHHIDFTLAGTSSTMTGFYTIQVQSTQKQDFDTYPPVQNYCSTLNVDGHSDWRLPTIIEAYAMWDKVRGSNNDASDAEPESKIFGAMFISRGYWSSSVFNGYADRRCGLDFGNGFFSAGYTNYNNYVRCVRDL